MEVVKVDGLQRRSLSAVYLVTMKVYSLNLFFRIIFTSI